MYIMLWEISSAKPPRSFRRFLAKIQQIKHEVKSYIKCITKGKISPMYFDIFLKILNDTL